MSQGVIGIIGGMSWESTSSYYTALHQLARSKTNAWSQPRVIIDSLDFGSIVPLQQSGDWDGTGRMLADSAKRLEGAGATVLAISANTMHINYEQVAAAVSIPVLDMRVAVANEVLASGHSSLALLGTKYLMTKDFYSNALEASGVRVVLPNTEQIDRLQSIIFEELTLGVIRSESRQYFHEVAAECRARGAEVIGLCCTEFGLLMSEKESFPVIDSTMAHVRALLAATE